MTKFTERGVPILTLHEKLTGLAYCMARGHHEDAAGHLCDLLEHCRKNIHPSLGPQFADLKGMIAYYGQNPTPIDENPS